MADAMQRVSSTPLSASPRSSSALSRPHWPWSTYTHRSSQSQLLSTSQSLDPRMNTSYIPAHHTGSTINNASVDTTRQWSFLGFEWLVRDVARLKGVVEDSLPNEANDDFEILRESPMLGDGAKFKLEIAPTPLADNADENTLRTLSIFLTSLMIDYAHAEYESSASIMVAIKYQSDRIGERGARVQWIWESWHDWSFRQGQEVWDCPLPPFSQLLENTRIAMSDSFVLCIQVHCPTGPFIPQQPSAYYVPRDLLDGLEASLDNANTGDVQFVCLERLNPSAMESTTNPNSPTLSTSSFDRRSSTSLRSASFQPNTTARKRVIYAHSDILIRRSEYFATMLGSSFSENLTIASDGRKMFVIVVEEADFETIYWLLKYCYANWLLFKEADDDDPRVAVESVGAGWSVHSLNNSARLGEWDWKTFQKTSSSDDSTVADSRSATSGDGPGTPGETIKPKSTPERSSIGSSALRPSMARAAPSPSKHIPSPIASRPTTATRRTTGNSSAVNETSALSLSLAGASQAKPAPVPISIPNNYSKPGQFHLSPRAGVRPTVSSPDPHPHPTPQPLPASSLSMYQLAHRYGMPGLAALAMEHMMSTITPQSSFALLLATTIWDELHSLIEDYVVEKWELVSASSQFEQCCDEISAGEWGSEGGKMLMTLFRRLRSPNAAYPRS